MAYDIDLANRIREILAAESGVDEKPMFGGLAFLIGGNMAVCVSGQGGIMVRVPRDDTAQLLEREHVHPMVMAGRETKGWVRIRDGGIRTAKTLRPWVNRGVNYAKSLPAK